MTQPVRRILVLILTCGVAAVLFPAAAGAEPRTGPPPIIIAPAEPKTPVSPYTGDVIVKFRSGSDAATSRAAASRASKRAAAQAGLKGSAEYKRTLATGGTLVSGAGDPVAMAASLRADGQVAYAVPDVKVGSSGTNDPDWGRLWQYHTGAAGIGVEKAWTRTSGSAALPVAVVDSGRTDHPDLAGQFVGGYDFVSDPTAGGDGDGRDSNPTDEGDFCTPVGYNSSWHGTHVAGLVNALRNNGVGTVGVAPEAKVVPVRVLGRCFGSASDMLDGMVWAAGGTVPGAPANPNPARIVNLSIGSIMPMACDAAMTDAIRKMRALGALPVVAAGNNGAAASGYAPANCPGSFVVGATDSTGKLASYSNYGPQIAVTAPGGDPAHPIYSSWLDATTTNSGRYVTGGMVGTSMAAPQVSGVAALILGQNPGMSLYYLEMRIRQAAKPCQGCGAGLIDATLATNAKITALGRWSSPSTGGDLVNLYGWNLYQGGRVTLAGRPATIVRIGVNFVTVRMPATSPGKYPLVLTSSAGVGGYISTYATVGRPTVTAKGMGSARPGTIIAVYGWGYINTLTSVKFGSTPASWVYAKSASTVLVKVPYGRAGTKVSITVTTPMGTSQVTNLADFVYQ